MNDYSSASSMKSDSMESHSMQHEPRFLDKDKLKELIKNEINNQLMFTPDADKEVLLFITKFTYNPVLNVSIENSYESIRSLFHAGYCYYFAHMLQLAFGRGEVCWACPFSHFVWVDVNDIPYDIEGVSSTEAELFIPEKYFNKNQLEGFLHNSDNPYVNTKEDGLQIIRRFIKENPNIEFNDYYITSTLGKI